MMSLIELLHHSDFDLKMSENFNINYKVLFLMITFVISNAIVLIQADIGSQYS